MIYTTQLGESFDAEILRQELVAAIGADGWYLNTAGNTVEFVCYTGAGPSISADSTVLAHFANGTIREANKAILKQIAELEATQTPRRVREGGQWMIDLEVKIAALRGQLL
jgi:hypothetical protein